MKFTLALALAFSFFALGASSEESPVGAGDSSKATDTTTASSSSNVTALEHPDPVNSEQKISNLSASKEKPEVSVGDKITGAAADAKDAVAGAAKGVSDAAGTAANKVSAEVPNGASSTFGFRSALSVVSALVPLALAYCFKTSH